MVTSKFIPLILFLFLTVTVYSQNKLNGQNEGFVTKSITLPQLSPEANLLHRSLMQDINLDLLKHRVTIIKKGEQHFVPALIKVGKNFNIRTLDTYQVQVNSEIGQILSVWIPANQFTHIATFPEIKYIELARKTYDKLERARSSAKVDLVHNGINLSKSYTGKDVVMGILDIGFDYAHPAFRDANGNLRIKKSWEQNLDRSPPDGFNYGNDIEGDALFSELFDLTFSGHGTHVANVAGGADYIFDGRYNGVAYESDLVFVSLLQLEGLEGLNTGIIDGIKYVFNYAESVGKPAIINISQGHHTGPHDGTSLADQAIDALSGPGRIIVGAVGNEGDPEGFYLHFDHTFDSEKTVLTNIAWEDVINSGSTVVEIWGEKGAAFSVNIELHNPKSKTTEAASMTIHTAEPNSMIEGQLIDAENDTLTFTAIVEINPLNDRPHISLNINNTGQRNDLNETDLLDNDFIQLRFNGSSGQIHGYAANNLFEAFFTDLSGIGADEFVDDVRVIGGNPNYTIGELGGTANRIISVGGYMVNNTIVNTKGESLGTDEVIGDSYFRSSRGPTHDGRIKPDISAPAGWISAAENSFNQFFDPIAEVDTVAKETSGKWSFGARRGTSFASPMVAGIIAFMLEINPELTPEDIKEMFSRLSDIDVFTGEVPNNVWGYGKVNAQQLISELEIATFNNDYHITEIQFTPNPTTGWIQWVEQLSGPSQAMVFNAQGILVKQMQLLSNQNSIDLSNLENGIYWLHIINAQARYGSKIIVVK